MLKDIKKLDFYRKIHPEFTESTNTGAGLSVFGAVVLFVLFILEFNSYLTVNTTTQIVMDNSADDMLMINFNVTLTKINCRAASVDVYDVLKTKKINITRDIDRWTIDSETAQKLQRVGDNIPAPRYEELNLESHPGHKDGEEISAELEASKFDAFVKDHGIAMVNFYAPWCVWCNRLHPVWEHTAGVITQAYGDEVQFAKMDCTKVENQEVCQANHINAFPTIIVYRNGKGHSHEHYHGDRTAKALVEFVKQVRKEEKMPERRLASERAKADPAVSDGPRDGSVRATGCMISGRVNVKKVPGNLVFSVGASGQSFDNSLLDLSHTVHALSFGPRVRTRYKDQIPTETWDSMTRLSGASFGSEGKNSSHEHYIKVVGQAFNFLSGETIDTYTYSVNSHTYIDTSDRAAIKFTYDLSPMSVVLTEDKMPMYHFLTSVCAIIGGVFTVLGLIDSMVYHGVNALQKKMSMGKHL